MLQEHRNQPPRFDESTSWLVFCCQFEAMVGHKNSIPCEKSMHLLAIPQGLAVSVLHCVPTEATYREITGAMRVATGATPWLQNTAFTWKQGPSSLVSSCRSLPTPSRSWPTTPLLDYLNTVVISKQSMHLSTG
jgi:hypothetical protein